MFSARLSLYFHGLLFWIDCFCLQKKVKSSTSTQVPDPTLEDCTPAEIPTHTKMPPKRGKLLSHSHSSWLEEAQRQQLLCQSCSPSLAQLIISILISMSNFSLVEFLWPPQKSHLPPTFEVPSIHLLPTLMLSIHSLLFFKR